MYAYRLIILLILSLFAQGASAATIWLKDKSGNVCTNTSSTNLGQAIGYGGVSRDGSGFTLTIDNPAAGAPTTGECKNIPMTDRDSLGNPVTNAPIVFNGALTPHVVPINATKDGTNGNPECLDQGSNYSGVSGEVAENAATPRYKINFNFSYTDGCTRGPPVNLNPGQPDFIRDVSIGNMGGPISIVYFSGKYHISVLNQLNPIPEPGSIALILAGALALWGIAGLHGRRKQARTQP